MSLADDVERELYRLLTNVNDNRHILGVKVVGARKGSIVIDVVIIYREKSTQKLAYSDFLEALSFENTQNANSELKIKSDIKPTLVSAENTTGDDKKLVIVLAVVIPVVLVVLFSSLAFYHRARRYGAKNAEK